MPAPIRARTLPSIVAVGRGTNRWGTMSLDDQRQFPTRCPGLLDALNDRPSLGALLSTNALEEYRNGSHSQAHQLMRPAVATGHPSPACVDRLTIDLVKLGEKHEAATILRDALARPIPSDSLRGRMTKHALQPHVATADPTDLPFRHPTDWAAFTNLGA